MCDHCGVVTICIINVTVSGQIVYWVRIIGVFLPQPDKEPVVLESVLKLHFKLDIISFNW